MVKRNKTAESLQEGVEEKQGKEKKQKKQKGRADPAPETEFSLFGKTKDAELDDVFSKGVSHLMYSLKPADMSHHQAAFAQSSSAAVTRPIPLASPFSHAEPVGVAIAKPSGSLKPKKGKKATAPPNATRLEPDEVLQPDASTSGPTIPSRVEGDADSDSADDSEAELVHESLNPSTSKRVRVKSTAKKYTPANETAADRDRRTIFVGNLPIDVAKTKVSLKIRSCSTIRP